MRDEAEGDEYKQDVQVRAKEKELVRAQPGWFALGAEGVYDALIEWLRALRAIAIF